MLSALKYKLKQQQVLSDIHQSTDKNPKAPQNMLIHVNVLNQHHVNEDIALQSIHGATINYLYTITKLVKELKQYLNQRYSKAKYCIWSIDYDDKDAKHFYCLSCSEQYKEVSKQCIIDYWSVARMINISISFKILCTINVPIQIVLKDSQPPSHGDELILSVPYSNKYSVAQLMDDAKKAILKQYKNEMDICGFEIVQNLPEIDCPVTSWNAPLFCHQINKESNDLESLHFKIILSRHTEDCKTCKYLKKDAACRFSFCGLKFIFCGCLN
eukprot:149792_1